MVSEYEQLSLFSCVKRRNGTYVDKKGPRLSWDDIRPGMTVIYDCSTQSHEWLMVTTAMEIIQTVFGLRVILDGGRGHRPLIDQRYIDKGSVKLYWEAKEYG